MAEEPKKDEAAEEGAKKGGKKKIIIIIVAVVLALVGGGAGWYFMQPKHEEGEEEVHHEEHKEVHPPEFLPLETFTVNLQPDPDERFLQLDATLQVSSPEVAEALKVRMPAIRNRMLMLLTAKKASDISTTEGKEELSEEILETLQEPFTEEGEPLEIDSVLFTSFVIQ